MYDRTPAPEIDRIWSRRQTTTRWFHAWVLHLSRVTTLNPKHPGLADLEKYARVARDYQIDREYARVIDDAILAREQTTRHDLVAALEVFNAEAGADSCHHGLTSHDIVDVATAGAIETSTEWLHTQTREVCRQLADLADQTRRLRIVTRTHGQPAQASVYGLRIASVLSPLMDWAQRLRWWQDNRPRREMLGAVGTGADLERVLRGWGNHEPGTLGQPKIEQYTSGATARAQRQIYHRSIDLHTAALLAELASIAQTYANDRRHETILGYGSEGLARGQVGSSAMPHKTNPILAERMFSLAAVARGHLTTAAELAGTEWMEGDVSASAARRSWLPQIFRTASQLLTVWQQHLQVWHVDRAATFADVERHRGSMYTGAALHWLLERGVLRDQAHAMVAAVAAELKPDDGPEVLVSEMLGRIGVAEVGVTPGEMPPWAEGIGPALDAAWRNWQLHLRPATLIVERVVQRARTEMKP